MFKTYLISLHDDVDGFRLIHTAECDVRPKWPKFRELGIFLRPYEALTEAAKLCSNFKLCEICCSQNEADDFDIRIFDSSNEDDI